MLSSSHLNYNESLIFKKLKGCKGYPEDKAKPVYRLLNNCTPELYPQIGSYPNTWKIGRRIRCSSPSCLMFSTSLWYLGPCLEKINRKGKRFTSNSNLWRVSTESNKRRGQPKGPCVRETGAFLWVDSRPARLRRECCTSLFSEEKVRIW